MHNRCQRIPAPRSRPPFAACSPEPAIDRARVAGASLTVGRGRTSTARMTAAAALKRTQVMTRRPRAPVPGSNRKDRRGLHARRDLLELGGLGGTVFALSPAGFGKFIADETEKWAKVIRAANIKPA